MKWIEDLLFTQHYELKKKERPTKSAKSTGIILVSVFVVMMVVAVLMILFALGIFSSLNAFGSGKSMGKALGLLLFGAAFGIIYLNYGSDNKYNALLDKYYQLNSLEQEAIYKKGLRKMLLIFISLMTIIIIFAVIGSYK